MKIDRVNWTRCDTPYAWIAQVMESHGMPGWQDTILASAPILDAADVAIIDRAMLASSHLDLPSQEETRCTSYSASLDVARAEVIASIFRRAARKNGAPEPAERDADELARERGYRARLAR